MNELLLFSYAKDNLNGMVYYREPPAKIDGINVGIEHMLASGKYRIRNTCFRGEIPLVHVDNLESKEAADVALDLLKEN